MVGQALAAAPADTAGMIRIAPTYCRRYWDWQLNHIGSVYGAMDEVFQFVETFKDFPPRSFPPSSNPANILESPLDGIKEDRRLKHQLDLDRIRGRLNRMIEQQLQDRGRR